MSDPNDRMANAVCNICGAGSESYIKICVRVHDPEATSYNYIERDYCKKHFDELGIGDIIKEADELDREFNVE